MAKKDAAKATSSTDRGGRLSKRSTRAILITAPIVALAVILGVLLGRKKGSTDTGGGGGAGDNNDKPTDIFIKSPREITPSPSSMPSSVSTLAPTQFTCPLDVNKKFVVINSSRTRRQRHHRRWLQWRQQQHQRSLSTYSTWFVKDVCSGDVILSCNRPCPSSAVARSSSSSTAVMHDNNNGRYLQGGGGQEESTTQQCIPGDREYVFVVEPAESPDTCCGFDANTFVLTYDDYLVTSGINGLDNRSVFFGQAGVPCPSNSPSVSPSETSSAVPTMNPTVKPTTRSPTTLSPTRRNFLFSATSSPTMNPTAKPTTRRPTMFVPILGSTGGDDDNEEDDGLKQIETPVVSPPTLRPTCPNYDKDFNLCLAVDMSGSICSSNSGCINCPNECREDFVTLETCCQGFAYIKGFASLLISSLSKFPSDKTFSIVQFANEGKLVSMMESTVEATSTIDELRYTGGITNHAEAISACRQGLMGSLAFQQSSTPRKSIMMLITDGVPTTPENDPEGAALTEAMQAKEDGVFIIPVFISPRYDANAFSFMSELSSARDGEVFDVVDYESLDTLKDRLLEEVSCLRKE